MKVSPPVRPWLISCSPNREFLSTIVSCNYFRQRNVKKVTKLKTSCTSSLDDHDIANSPSYPIIRPRKNLNFDEMYIYRLIIQPREIELRLKVSRFLPIHIVRNETLESFRGNPSRSSRLKEENRFKDRSLRISSLDEKSETISARSSARRRSDKEVKGRT